MTSSSALAGALLLALAGASAGAQEAPPTEYEVKAVYLFGFLKFVEWPPAAFPGPDAPIVIGVLGKDPFGPLLEEATRGETVGGRGVEVRRSKRLDQLGPCQLLFISRSERPRLASILGGLQGRPILTVGETGGFARRGGMINFVLRRDRVAFEINASAAERAGLKISSQLLQLARTSP